MHVSRRARAMQASPIRKLAPLSAEAKKRGIHVYHLNIGQPDLPTPHEFLEALTRFSEPVLAYGPSDGLPAFREAVCEYFSRYGIHLRPDEVLTTTGGSEAILFAFNVVADEGDEIIVPEPFYTNYNGYAQMAHVRLKPVRTHAEDGFHLPPDEELEAAIAAKTRAFLLCSPNNPTGTVLTREELERVAALCRKYNLFLIADEVYKEFTYDGRVHTSALELPGMERHVIVVDSVSKRFSACGARVGALISRNREVMHACLKLGQARLCPPTLEQLGAVAAYKLGEDYFAGVRNEYQRRRDVLYDRLTAVPGIVLRKPRGAFYMIVKMEGIEDADEFAAWLLRDFSYRGETVMVAPASGFYATPGAGKNEVRIAYVLEVPKLERAAEVFLAGLEQYRTLAPAAARRSL